MPEPNEATAGPLATSDRPDKSELIITYNGIDKALEYRPDEAMTALLERALDAFDVRENRHTMALWTTAGMELPIEGTVRDAGVKPGEVLVLRPSAVRGGTSC
jgi:hypothetical protein